jgi:undecaprenyl-diphosphatase
MSVAALTAFASSTPSGGVPGGPLGTGGFRDVNDFAKDPSWLHGALADYANYGVVLFGLLLVVGFLWSRSRSDLSGVAASLWAAAGMGIAIALNQLIVHAVDEPRPFASMSNVLLLVHHANDPGFTSDHSVMAGAVAAGLFFVRKVLGWITAAAAVLIAFARVYVGVHFPQDVLAGLALGVVVVLVGWLLVRPALVGAMRGLERTPMRWAVSGRRHLTWLQSRAQ